MVIDSGPENNFCPGKLHLFLTSSNTVTSIHYNYITCCYSQALWKIPSCSWRHLYFFIHELFEPFSFTLFMSRNSNWNLGQGIEDGLGDVTGERWLSKREAHKSQICGRQNCGRQICERQIFERQICGRQIIKVKCVGGHFLRHWLPLSQAYAYSYSRRSPSQVVMKSKAGSLEQAGSLSPGLVEYWAVILWFGWSSMKFQGIMWGELVG